MYTVSITNPNPAIGAKCRKLSFNEYELAGRQFDGWRKWLNATVEPYVKGSCLHKAIGDDGYILTLEQK